jgi:hypothetical protein
LAFKLSDFVSVSIPDWAKIDMENAKSAEIQVFTNHCHQCGMVYKTVDHPWNKCQQCGADSTHLTYEHHGQHYGTLASLAEQQSLDAVKEEQAKVQAALKEDEDAKYFATMDAAEYHNYLLEKHEHKGPKGDAPWPWTSSTANPQDWKSYLYFKGISQAWLVFKLNEDGKFEALFSEKSTTFSWSQTQLTVLEEEHTANHLADACGGFVVDPFDPACPVRVHWDMWLSNKKKGQYGPLAIASAWFVIID